MKRRAPITRAPGRGGDERDNAAKRSICRDDRNCDRTCEFDPACHNPESDLLEGETAGMPTAKITAED